MGEFPVTQVPRSRTSPIAPDHRLHPAIPQACCRVNQRPDIELLSPAGNWECARAAVANGADAIYFGMPQFNARLRAENFQTEELPELMAFLHQHGVRGFVAFNTLVFTGELAAAEAQLAWLQKSGVDAIIVQDLGLASVAKRIAPDVELHASTQMTITSPEGLAFAQQLGLDRAVLAREVSLRELEKFRGSPVPLEVFVHGALCVAYSGQCLTSESLGQRSANRGECAQACRMPYQLVVDGEVRDLGDKKYLLSPQDLAAVQEIPALIELGVTSFKIEGRLKSPEYVAAVTKVYRKAIDTALEGKEFKESKSDRYSLEMTFSRGLFTGWMHGVNHQELVGARYGKKRGAFLGRVQQVDRDAVEMEEMLLDMKPGDGVVFDTGEDTNQEQGGFVYAVEGHWLEFQRGKLDLQRIPPGTRVWKTSDPLMERQLRATFKGTLPIRKHRKLRCLVVGNTGSPLAISALNEVGEVLANVKSTSLLQTAAKHPMTTATLQTQIGKLGGTPWELIALENQVQGEVILPLSELNQMRRDLLAAMDSPQESTREKASTGLVARELENIFKLKNPRTQPADLSVTCRTLPQVEAALKLEIPIIYIDFEDIRRAPESVKLAANSPASQIFLATPRIQKASEEGFFKLLQRAEPNGILLRNLGGVAYFRDSGLRLHGDFSLNVANPLSAHFLIEQGLERLTISSDLTAEQALDLLADAPPEWFEIILHQHMPMFHMEHCVFAAFMSSGKTFLDCGRPCEKHQVRLRDRVGMEHPLKADVGCRNTLYNAVAQTGAKYFPVFHSAGLRHFRIDLLEESPEEVIRIVGAYRSLLAGDCDAESLWRDLKARSQLGVTSGTLREIAT